MFVAGERVILRRDVERYPHLIACKGEKGTVTTVEYDGGGELEYLHVKMDNVLHGLEEWNNELMWDRDWSVDDVMADLEPLRKVLIVDQFCGLTPHWLQVNPIAFVDLLTEDFVSQIAENTGTFGQKPTVTEVPESYRPKLCTTVIDADADGRAHAWKYNWDSSG